MTITKIKIADDVKLREELDREYEKSSQIPLCKYALALASHILETVNDPQLYNETVKEGFLVNKKWQEGNVRVHDVRNISFRIHQLAKTNEDPVSGAALRVIGHAVAAGHMKEHAMVASDYAVKVINLLHPENMDAVKKERLWQIEHLKEINRH